MSPGSLAPTFERRRNRFRTRELGAAVAALGAATPASATIISQTGLSWGVGDGFDLVLGDSDSAVTLLLTTNMAGQDSLGFNAPGMGMGASTVEWLATPVGMGMGAVDYLALLAPGDTVDATVGTLAWDEPAYLLGDDATDGPWSVGTTGYAGFRFDDGSGTVYGYMEIRFDSATDFTVLSWAYQDDGSSITIPEPALCLLLGLGAAALALGVRGWKRPRLPDARAT